MQQALTSLTQSFFQWLFNPDPEAEAQKQQMMEELARREAEAERQHRLEEAQRLEAIFNRLSATLKLDGLPKLQMKDQGLSGGGLHLKLGESGDEHVGIQGLPGIALNDTTGNGGNTPYGIPGLPGIYTNGPASGSSPAQTSQSTLQMKIGEESASPQPAGNLSSATPLPAPASGSSPAQTSQSTLQMKIGEENASPQPAGNLSSATPLPAPAAGNVVPPGMSDPRNMTPQQLADVAARVSSLPPEEQQRLMNAAQNAAKGNLPGNRSEVTAPSITTTTPDQLTLSAGLGQKAVQAAQGGNLEDARHLADLSAQAMNGNLSRSELAKLNIVLPEAKPAPVSPANVQLQKEMLKKTNEQIVALGQNPSSGGTVTTTLAQLNTLYDQVRDKPAAASDYLVQLQTGQVPTAAKPLVGTACGESSLGETTMPADRKEYLTKRLSEARDRLRYINEALRKLIAINTTERAEIDKLTAEITVQYHEAQDRAFDVVIDLMTSVSLDAFGAQQDKRVKSIDDAIQGETALKLTPLDAAALQKVEEDTKLLQSAKFRSEEAYAPTSKLIDLFDAASYGKDIEDWRTKNQDALERAKSGLALVGNLVLDHPALERWLGRKAFFANDELWQVRAMGKMTYYACGFFQDVVTQLAVWGPMTSKLQNELEYNVQGLEHLRQSAEQTSQEISCLEGLLR
jgi:hypothetical protein